MKRLAKFMHPVFVSTLLILIDVFPGTSIAGIPAPSQLVFGGAVGLFRISATHYKTYYDSPWVSLPQIQVGIGFSSSSFLMFKASRFSKNGRTFEADVTPQRKWEQRCFEVGYRRYSTDFPPSTRTFMGFGLAFFQIRETPLTFLQDLGSHSENVSPKGFYLEIGLEHFFTHSLSLSFDMDLSSAGLYNGTSFQSQSIGGLFLGIATKYFIF